MPIPSSFWPAPGASSPRSVLVGAAWDVVDAALFARELAIDDMDDATVDAVSDREVASSEVIEDMTGYVQGLEGLGGRA